MMGEQDIAGESVEEVGTPSAVPPSYGLARSIRSLFENRPARPERESEERATAAATTDGDVAESEVSEFAFAGGDSGIGGAGPRVRDRFVTRVARFLRTAPGDRSEEIEAILTEATALREEGAYGVLLDAVVSLVCASGNPLHGGGGVGGLDAVALEDEGRDLARKLYDLPVANHLARRLGSEREPELRDPLRSVATAFPAITSSALVESLVESSDRAVRRSLMDLLVELGEDGRSAVFRLLRDPRWYAVRNGVHLLAETGDPGAVQALTTPLAHPDPRVRKETVVALSKLGGEDAGLLLVGMLSDPHPPVREAAAMGVGALRVQRALRPLLEMLATEGEETVQAQTLLALGQIGDPGAVPAIEKKAVGSMFSRPPRALRVAAYRALAAIGTPHARGLVEAAASDRDPEVRLAVESILSRVPSRTSGGKAVQEEEVHLTEA